MSNLLDKASIILTPTAYNNGEALCVKPSDGSGDFDFSRNSAATRVNAQGLVENVQILSSNLVQNGDFSEEGVQEVSNGSFSQEGSELVTNGNFATDSDWTKGTGWSISGGTANYDGLQAYQLLRQGTANGVIGKTYLVKYDVINNNGTGGIIAKFGGVNLSSYNSDNGSFEFYVEAISTDYIRFTPQLDFNGSIDNVSVREVGQDWTLGTGWSIGEDKANGDGSGTAYSIALQSTPISAISGNTVKLEYTISNYVSGIIRPTLGVVNGLERNSNGTFIEYIKLGSNAPSLQLVNRATALNASITNISVKEVGQDWTLETGWSIGEGKAISDGSGSVPNTDLVQSSVFTSGNTYKVSLQIKDYVSGRLELQNNTTDFPQANGTHTIYLVAGGGTAIVLRSRGFIGSITNISVIEITDDTNLPRINYEGFSYQDALGSELVTNGDFSSDTGWSKQTGWTIANGKATSAGSTGSVYQTNRFYVPSKKYKISYTISEHIGGSLRMVWGNAVGIRHSSNGTFTEILSPTGGGNVMYMAANGTFTGSIDNVSIKEVLGQEVVPDSGCGSWLFEPQSTNLITYSEDFSGWASNFTSLTSGFNSPDGASGATLLSGDGVNVYPNISRSAGSAGDVSYSVFVKKELSDEIALRLQGTDVGGVGNVNAVYTYTFSTNSFATVSAGVAESFSAQPLVDGWIRLQLNFTSTTITACRIYPAYGTASTDGVYIWGAQLEALPYATSYIPTEGSTVTRNQDVCTNGGSLASINSTEGVLYAEIAALADDGTFKFISLNTNASNRLRLGYSSTTNKISVLIQVDGAVKFNNSQIGNINQVDFNKIAVSYSASGVKVFVNGVEVNSNTVNSSFALLNKLDFRDGDTLNPFYGKTKALAVFPYLTDAELTELTTI